MLSIVSWVPSSVVVRSMGGGGAGYGFLDGRRMRTKMRMRRGRIEECGSEHDIAMIVGGKFEKGDSRILYNPLKMRFSFISPLGAVLT